MIPATIEQNPVGSFEAPTREQILDFEALLKRFDQLDMPLTHTFAPGAYARTILLPKGAVVVGKIHRHAHLNIISKGKVSVVTEFGRMDITGPHVFTSLPGTKRALCVVEECVWTTIHLTGETDLAKIEEQIIAKTYEELPPAIVAECMELLENQS
jgi:hypothetical protein